MRNTYFYDSDLYGGSCENISSCLLLSTEQEKLSEFSLFWNDKISNIKNKDEENACFLNLLVDLSLKSRDVKAFDIMLVIFDAEYFDFMYLLSVLAQKSAVNEKFTLVPQLFHLWENMSISALIDKAENMSEIQSIVMSYLKCINSKNIISFDVDEYKSFHFSYFESSSNFNVARRIVNRFPIYTEIFKFDNAEYYVPNGIIEKDFYKLYKVLSSNGKIKKVRFIEKESNTSLVRILSFLSRHINNYMDKFNSGRFERIEQDQKNILILIWGLWLSTAQNISLIPIPWYMEYRNMLADFLGK